MRWNIPNILTIARLLAAPAFALAYVVAPRPAADWIALVIFVAAALTDYLDGYLARAWDQVSGFGRMLDPIADKAMVVIALAVVIGLSGLNPLIVIPATLILFREVFVSGLREFLGADAGRLKVTPLAKWKTTVQMIAVPVVLLAGVFQLQFQTIYYQLEPSVAEAIMSTDADDPLGLRSAIWRYQWAQIGGLVLLWIAAILTLITGLDYFRKSMPYMSDERR